ncbi:MAG TPA: FMN-binding negative transcriptional regulator [Ideonella sp.]|uniref:FMN-binding negative transcriptional regulator n=1 Tax=Ideonella sp. TaxID=1929293 RepID=UPI002E320F2A|nr:FMN-binding negative transcriptional regulator [Ideonella sp.]HEX5686630.1 FMN-binding negative transcriptional regulator [Ideonella sp.]
MNTPEIFRPANDSDIDRMVAAYPLALVISMVDGDTQASPLPIVLQRDAEGRGTLIGHFSRFNPQVEMVRRDRRALIAFSGAQGYISSSWLRERKYAPTWNYQAVHFKVDIEIDERPGAAREALETLIRHADAAFPNPWRVEEMGPRFEQISTAIVPFRARVLDTQVQFKLGQGDPASVFEDGIAGLMRYGNHELATAMLREHAGARAGN